MLCLNPIVCAALPSSLFVSSSIMVLKELMEGTFCNDASLSVSSGVMVLMELMDRTFRNEGCQLHLLLRAASKLSSCSSEGSFMDSAAHPKSDTERRVTAGSCSSICSCCTTSTSKKVFLTAA